jgi:single-stranded DNA-specific DHH superfamily exonuclease
MLGKKEISEIKKHLERAQNPLFLFDNDPDGLCSFLLLQRYIGRGKGFAVTSFPDLNVDYFRRVRELNADYVFILDKPLVSKEFLEEANKINIPVVWIDHHEICRENVPTFVNYYNPLYSKDKINEPVTALCYEIVKNKEDLWIAVAGCISDKFIPDFYLEFKKKYPDLYFDSENAFEILYKSEIGKIARIFNFALKDRITNVISMLKFLMKVKNPYEVLEESRENFTMHYRFNKINKKYIKLLEKAKELEKYSDKIFFFKYSGDLSMSSDLSNELSYLFPDKIIVVIYVSGNKANVSVRGKKIRQVVLKSIENLENATGGGHEDAVGARIKIEDIEDFKENMILNI